MWRELISFTKSLFVCLFALISENTSRFFFAFDRPILKKDYNVTFHSDPDPGINRVKPRGAASYLIITIYTLQLVGLTFSTFVF